MVENCPSLRDRQTDRQTDRQRIKALIQEPFRPYG